jgi:hypothetical protein
LFLRFLAGLLVIDAALVAAFTLPPRSQTTAPIATQAPAPTAKPEATWNGIDPVAVADRTATLYQAIRRGIGKNRRVVLSPPRRTGDDVELRISLAKLADARAGQGYPAGVFCFHCAQQRCLYPADTVAALEALANAVPAVELGALAEVAGKDKVVVSYIGGASGGPVVVKDEIQFCDGEEPRTESRWPADFDPYDAATCGAHACEVAGSGKVVRVDTGPIDDNEKLACLRAVCLHAGSATQTVPAQVRYVGELAYEQGAAHRGAEVVVTVRGIGAPEHQAAYQRFWDRLTTQLGEPK